MGIKSLFIIEDKSQSTEDIGKENLPTQTFPTATSVTPQTTFPTTPVFTSQINNEHVNKFIEKYQSTFDALNLAGYDFYEFYNALIKTNGIDNLQMYQMAISMATAMDTSITKEKLLSQADFYIGEINKLYAQIVNDGNLKKAHLVSEKDSEKQQLTSELTALNQQLLLIQTQITEKQSLLSGIESKYTPLIAEVSSKLVANDSAKNEILNKISKVKTNLSQI